MNLPQVIEVKGVRVLTSDQLADAYETGTTNIKTNFSRNRTRFIEGKHYIAFTGNELREFKKNKVTNCNLVGRTANILYLWTEKGALLHAKSLNTDKAWEVYDYLVDYYFRSKEQKTEVTPVQQAQVKPQANTEESKHYYFDMTRGNDVKERLDDVRRMAVTIDTLASKAYRYQTKKGFKTLIRAMMSMWLDLGDPIRCIDMKMDEILQNSVRVN